MTLRSLNGNYLLRGELTHKEEYEFQDGTTIYIAKEYENNLRERNAQIGTVIALPDDNTLNLSVGDRVYVNHMVFYGEIGSTSKNHVLQDHVKYEGELLFSCPVKHIYYKIIGDELIPLGDILLMEPIVEEEIQFGIYLGEKERKDIATVVKDKGKYKTGEVLIVETNALYPIQYKKKNYFRLRIPEVMGKIKNDKIIPDNDRIVMRDIHEEAKSVLDLSFMRGVQEVKSTVLAVGQNVRHFDAGDVVIRRKSRGRPYKGDIVITVQGKLEDTSIWGKITEECTSTEA